MELFNYNQTKKNNFSTEEDLSNNQTFEFPLQHYFSQKNDMYQEQKTSFTNYNQNSPYSKDALIPQLDQIENIEEGWINLIDLNQPNNENSQIIDGENKAFECLPVLDELISNKIQHSYQYFLDQSNEISYKQILQLHETNFNRVNQNISKFNDSSIYALNQIELEDKKNKEKLINQQKFLKECAKNGRKKSGYQLDNVRVNKLKNFYKTLMNRISPCLKRVYHQEEHMVNLIQELCSKSNQRNFLTLFPHLKQNPEADRKEENNCNPKQINDLKRLRKTAFKMFGQNIVQLSRILKCSKSFTRTEEFIYGCLFFADRSLSSLKKQQFSKSVKEITDILPVLLQFSFNQTDFEQRFLVNNELWKSNIEGIQNKAEQADYLQQIRVSPSQIQDSNEEKYEPFLNTPFNLEFSNILDSQFAAFQPFQNLTNHQII